MKASRYKTSTRYKTRPLQDKTMLGGVTKQVFASLRRSHVFSEAFIVF